MRRRDKLEGVMAPCFYDLLFKLTDNVNSLNKTYICPKEMLTGQNYKEPSCQWKNCSECIIEYLNEEI